jgi:3-(3-hydroxy-phenyl)propionate hydroxylase
MGEPDARAPSQRRFVREQIMALTTSALPDRYDVAVVGCGPVGATLAALLGKRGWRVAILDKSREIFPLPRAIGLDHEVIRVLQGIGQIECLLPFTAPYRPSVYLGCDGEPILRFDIGPPPFPLGWRPNYTFNQPKFEQWLRDRIANLQSVDVHLGVEVIGIADGPHSVTLSLNGAPHQTMQARYVVACDGATSPARRMLGIALEDLEFDEHWLVIDMILSQEAQARLPDTNIQYCQPERPSTYVVLPGNHRRWEIMINDGEDPDSLLKPDTLWSLLGRWITPADAELWRAASYRFHAVVARQWRSGRCFLAGDSAHQMPPFLAQGMCQGIRDAANLEWKLSMVLGGLRFGKLLDSYEAERKPNIGELTKVVWQLGKVICERDRVAALRRDEDLRAEQGGTIKTKIRQDLIPAIKGGITSPGSQAAGTPFPQPFLARGDEPPLMLDDATGARFRIISSRKDKLTVDVSLDPFLQDIDAALIEVRDGEEIFVNGTSRGTDNYGQLASWFAQHQCDAAIVRPDGYVFGTSRSTGGLQRLLVELKAHILD